MKTVDDPELEALIHSVYRAIGEAGEEFVSFVGVQCERLTAAAKARGTESDFETCIGSVAHIYGHIDNCLEVVAGHFGVSEERVRVCETAFRVRFMRSIPYRTYLTLEHWHRQRKKALERAKHKCSLCSETKRLDVHHRSYDRLGDEAPEDLTVLCRRCHDNFHKTGRLARPKD